MWLSESISPLDPAERERIQAAGGFVTDNGRVCGVLAVSRTLGDIQFRQITSAEPSIRVHAIAPRDEWLILGCDGVWDELAPGQVAGLLRFVGDPIRAAQKIRDAAYDLGSRDNLSVVAVQLTRAPCW